MADDGDHYRLAFDKPGTWSQKYNLVWDKLLGYNLFPADVARKEMAYYKKVQRPYGLPLDNRKEYTKLDWILWTATLADAPADFAAFLDPVYAWMNDTPDRVPLTDWYWTNTGKQDRIPGPPGGRRRPDQDAGRPGLGGQMGPPGRAGGEISFGIRRGENDDDNRKRSSSSRPRRSWRLRQARGGKAEGRTGHGGRPGRRHHVQGRRRLSCKPIPRSSS